MLDEFLSDEVDHWEESHLPPVRVKRWELIACLLWKNNGTFRLPMNKKGLATHRRMTGIECAELHELKGVIFGASLYDPIWEEKYIPLIEERFKVLNAKRDMYANQVKWN